MSTRGKGKRSMSDRARADTYTSLLMEDENNQSASDSDSHDDLDDEQEVNEEVHAQQDLPQHTSGHSEPANLEIKDKVERDKDGREVLIIQGKSFISTAAPRSILVDMHGWYNGVWPTFGKVPEHIKKDLFERFKAKFTWRDPWSERQVYNIFKSYCSRSFSTEMTRLRNSKNSRLASPPDYMRSDIWEALWDIWETPKYKKLRKNNRKNRLSDRNGEGVVKSTAGTISIAHHAQRMAEKNDGKPVPHELVFSRCHRKNQGKGPFVDEKSKKTSENYIKLKEKQSQNSGSTISTLGSSTFYSEAWAEASGGLRNGHFYGFGNLYNESFTPLGPCANIGSSQVEVDQLKERIRELEREQQEFKATFNQFISTTLTTHSNVSGQHFSAGQYPSPGQYSAQVLGRYYAPAPSQLLTPTPRQYPPLAPGQYPPPAPDQYPPPTPGYFPAPALALGYFPAPASAQLHVTSNYRAPGQHPPVPYQPPDGHHSPNQHNSSGQHHTQD